MYILIENNLISLRMEGRDCKLMFSRQSIEGKFNDRSKFGNETGIYL